VYVLYFIETSCILRQIYGAPKHIGGKTLEIGSLHIILKSNICLIISFLDELNNTIYITY
jgi:hypothetical protein